MKRLSLVAALLAAFASAAWAGPATVGEQAPDFALKDLNGQTHRLSDHKGKVIVLEWFNPGCPYVVKHHQHNPTMKDLYTRYKTKEVVWLAVNSGAPGKQGHGIERNRKAKAKWGIEYPILIDEDGTVGRIYKARTTPHMYVIDTKGVLRYAGAIDNDRHRRNVGDTNYVSQALEAVFAGTEVPSSVTKPYGCSVKYGSKIAKTSRPAPIPFKTELGSQAVVGKKSPDFLLRDTDGKIHRLSKYKGKVVVLEWFNPGCPFVIKHHEQNKTMAELYARYKGKEVVWLAINSGAKGKQGHGLQLNKKSKAKWGIQYPVLLDPTGAVGRRFGARTTPQMYVIDAKGILRYDGAIDNNSHWSKLGDTNYVSLALEAVFSGAAVKSNKTKPYGCSVKYAPKKVKKVKKKTRFF